MSDKKFTVEIPLARLIAHWPLTIMGSVFAIFLLWGVCAILSTGLAGFSFIVTVLLSLAFNSAGGRVYTREKWRAPFKGEDFAALAMAPTIVIIFVSFMVSIYDDTFHVFLYLPLWLFFQASASWYLFCMHRRS